MQDKTYSFEYRIKEKDAEGKEVSVKKEADVTATHFSDVADVIAYYESEAKEDETGEQLLTAAINKMFKDTAIANERAKLTRVPKVPKALAERAKGLDESEQATFNALMEKMGLKIA